MRPAERWQGHCIQDKCAHSPYTSCKLLIEKRLFSKGISWTVHLDAGDGSSIPGCSPEHRLLRFRHVRQLDRETKAKRRSATARTDQRQNTDKKEHSRCDHPAPLRLRLAI